MGWWESDKTGRRYAAVYSHAKDAIEIRDRSQQGPTLHTLTNNTPLSVIANIFDTI
jgi:hypothetical protein